MYVQGSTPISNGTQNNFSQNGAGWIASTTVGLGTTIVDSNGNLQRVTAATGSNNILGTTKSGSAPVWSTTLNGTTTDNNVTWTLIQKPALSDYNFVNEVLNSSPNLGTSYMSDSNVNDQERFLMSPVTGTTIFGVAVNTRCQKDETGTRSYRSVVDSGGTIVDNGSDHALTQNYATVQDLYVTDPNTGLAWTTGGIGAAEFGVKLTV
jgi:hypothetical protein